jgi:hypothetical protein
MEQLQKLLKEKGYDTSLKNNKVRIKFSYMIEPATVSLDIPSNKFIVNSHELKTGLIGTYLLAYGLYLLVNGGFFYGAAMMAFSVWGLVTMILTEIKLTPVRQIIQALNGGEYPTLSKDL